MSGGISVQSGYHFDDVSGEFMTFDKVNKLVEDAVLRVMAGAITAREMADGAINSDKLDSEISAQIGSIPDGSITNAKMTNNSVDTAEIVDGSVDLIKLGSDVALGYADLTSNYDFTSDVVGGAEDDAAAQAALGVVDVTACQVDIPVALNDVIIAIGGISVSVFTGSISLEKNNSPDVANWIARPVDVKTVNSIGDAAQFQHTHVPLFGVLQATGAGTLKVYPRLQSATSGGSFFSKTWGSSYLFAYKAGSNI